MPSIPKLIGAIAALALMIASQRQIDQRQSDYDVNRMATDDVPATLAVSTFALGPMRTLVADALWWRAIRQQARGDYYDAMQLANWITTMQPTYSSVWSFQGWNISYNVVADFTDEEEKWRWIQGAIRLLRDEGLKYNPDNAEIRQQLAWIFHDKIGGTNDLSAEYYRQQWTFDMMKYFERGDRKELIELSRAPAGWKQLMADPEVMAFREFAAAKGIDVFDFAKHPPTRAHEGSVHAKALDTIYSFRKRFLIERHLKLDCDRMLYIDREYGPLDWRGHHAQTIYWIAEESFENFMTHSVNYAPILRQAMTQSFLDGRIIYVRDKHSIVRTHNLKILNKIHSTMDFLMMNQYSAAVDADHKKFLELAVTILYTYNRIDDAREAFDHFKIDYMRDEPIDFEAFIVKSHRNTMKRIGNKEARALVESTIFKSLMWLHYGEPDLSNGTLNTAKQMWKQHQLLYGESNPAKALPPFADMLRAAKTSYLSDNKLDGDEFSKKEEEVRAKNAERVDIGGVTGSVRPPGADIYGPPKTTPNDGN